MRGILMWSTQDQYSIGLKFFYFLRHNFDNIPTPHITRKSINIGLMLYCIVYYIINAPTSVVYLWSNPLPLVRVPAIEFIVSFETKITAR